MCHWTISSTCFQYDILFVSTSWFNSEKKIINRFLVYTYIHNNQLIRNNKINLRSLLYLGKYVQRWKIRYCFLYKTLPKNCEMTTVPKIYCRISFGLVFDDFSFFSTFKFLQKFFISVSVSTILLELAFLNSKNTLKKPQSRIPIIDTIMSTWIMDLFVELS